VETTELHFEGLFGLAGSLSLALLVGAMAWWLYWRETRARGGAHSILLPSLRAASIILILLILSGPILRHEKTIRHLGRVIVAMDASESMSLTDEVVPAPKKIAILNALGYPPIDDPVLRSAQEAASILESARTEASILIDAPPSTRESIDLTSLAKAYAAAIEGAYPAFARIVDSATPSPSQPEAISEAQADDPEAAGTEETQSPPRSLQISSATATRAYNDQLRSEAKAFAEECVAGTLVDPEIASRRLRTIDDARAEAAAQLDQAVENYVSARLMHEGQESPLAKAIATFDRLSRWERSQKLLLDPTKGIASHLADAHDLELTQLRGDEQMLQWWKSRSGRSSSGPLPTEWEGEPDANVTDLVTGLKARLADRSTDTAIVLVTDGQHNASTSPEGFARELRSLGVPLFTIGVGASRPFPDMSLLEVSAPEQVGAEDIARGQILVDDKMLGGGRYLATIEHNDRRLWENEFVANGTGERVIEFAFPMAELIAAADSDQTGNLALRLDASISQIDPEGSPVQEKIVSNNSRVAYTQAIINRPKVLILDGRPRWETRYLKNYFTRDERWDTNLLMAAESDQRAWPLGEGQGRFPESREALFAYDLIIFGELPPDWLNIESSLWLAEFVSARGGGIIFLDGPRGLLSELPGETLPELMPVRRIPGEELDGDGLTWALTAPGRTAPQLTLVADSAENAATWAALPTPARIFPSVAVPGAETLVEIEAGDATSPVMVWRRYGAGKVLWIGTDELWRWREENADRFHQQLWMQVASWIMDQPYTVEGELISLALDKLVYAPGEAAQIRARLRDASGAVDVGASLEASLFINDGASPVAIVPLEPDENMAGIYRANTSGLVPGSYSLKVIRRGEPEPYAQELNFEVEPRQNLELLRLDMNKTLLQTLAQTTGGEFVTEEDASGILNKIAALDRREVIRSEQLLWSSWWWFLPIIGLLTVEWIVRKRCGYL
jgi:hypothetical protein